MKPLSLCYALLLLAWHQRAVTATDTSSPPSPPPAVTEAASDANEQEFRDPFAEKGEENKPAAKVSDPLEPMNRAFFKFNDKLYFWVLKPAAKGYNKVAPEPFRESMKRLFVNARYPVRLVNNLLQGKFKGAGIETTRFLVNSTVGIGGLFDPAHDEWSFQAYPEDLDQTLGFYHVPTGPYLNWPLFGSSSVRGTCGTIGDSFLSVWNYVDGVGVLYGTRAFDTINSSSLRLGEYESFKEGSLDPYVSLRDAYFENRRSLVEQ
jgi:phospholipid-binding lipoprotein MlaA